MSIAYHRAGRPEDECDDTSGNSTDWSNGHWVKEFKESLNRWQMMTNGSTFYLLRPSSSRLTDVPGDDEDPMRQFYPEITGETCYVESFPVVYGESPQSISGTVNLKIGTLYPKKAVEATIPVYYFKPTDTADPSVSSAYTVRHLPPTRLFMLPDASSVLGSSGLSFGGDSPSNYRVVGYPYVQWRNKQDARFTFRSIQNLNTFSEFTPDNIPTLAKVIAVAGGSTTASMFFLPPNKTTWDSGISGLGWDYKVDASGYCENYTLIVTPTTESEMCTVQWCIVGAGGGGGGGASAKVQHSGSQDVLSHGETYGGGGGGSGDKVQISDVITTQTRYVLDCGYGGHGTYQDGYAIETAQDGGSTKLFKGSSSLVIIADAFGGHPGGNATGSSSGGTAGTGGTGLKAGGNGANPQGTGSNGERYKSPDGEMNSSGWGGTGGTGDGSGSFTVGGGGGGAGGYYEYGLENLARGSDGAEAIESSSNSDSPTAPTDIVGYGAGGGGGAISICGRDRTTEATSAFKSLFGRRGGSGWGYVVVTNGTITLQSYNGGVQRSG